MVQKARKDAGKGKGRGGGVKMHIMEGKKGGRDITELNSNPLPDS